METIRKKNLVKNIKPNDFKFNISWNNAQRLKKVLIYLETSKEMTEFINSFDENSIKNVTLQQGLTFINFKDKDFRLGFGCVLKDNAIILTQKNGQCIFPLWKLPELIKFYEKEGKRAQKVRRNQYK